jgi:hypothetical protein
VGFEAMNKQHQFILCTYPPDYKWAIHCLRSLEKFCTGFLPTVVCVAEEDLASAAQMIERAGVDNVILSPRSTRRGQGFMSAQIAYCKSDLYCTGDVLYFIGSDCLAFKPFGPETYCDENGLPVILYAPREVCEEHIKQVMPWLHGVERVLGIKPEAEYMRRLPTVLPREAFAPMRALVESRFGTTFEEYIYAADLAQSGQGVSRDTSEANIVAAYAWEHCRDKARWVNAGSEEVMGPDGKGWPYAICQMWSWGGLDRPTDSCAEIPGLGMIHGMRPREVIAKLLYDGLESAVIE